MAPTSWYRFEKFSYISEQKHLVSPLPRRVRAELRYLRGRYPMPFSEQVTIHGPKGGVSARPLSADSLIGHSRRVFQPEYS